MRVPALLFSMLVATVVVVGAGSASPALVNVERTYPQVAPLGLEGAAPAGIGTLIGQLDMIREAEAQRMADLDAVYQELGQGSLFASEPSLTFEEVQRRNVESIDELYRSAGVDPVLVDGTDPFTAGDRAALEADLMGYLLDFLVQEGELPKWRSLTADELLDELLTP